MSTWGGYNFTIDATRFQRSFIKDALDLSGSLYVRNGDISLNSRLFVQNDASFNNDLYVNNIITANLKVISNGDASSNRLFVQNDASFMSNLYVNNTCTVNANIISNGNVSLNGNVYIGNDISCNGNVNIGRDLLVSGNLTIRNYTSANIINTTTTNYQFVVSQDISLNGRLLVSNDTSLNGNLFVNKDISMNGTLYMNNIFLNNIKVNNINIGIKNDITNTLIGNLVLNEATNGINNTVVGQTSLQYYTGSNTTAFGSDTFSGNIYTASISGVSTLLAPNGNNNTIFGHKALKALATGSRNTGIGYSAGYTDFVNNYINTNLDGQDVCITGFTNTFIGSSVIPSDITRYNQTLIGFNINHVRPSVIMLGASSETLTIPRIMIQSTPPIIYRAADPSVNQVLTAANTTNTVIFPTVVYEGANTFRIVYDSSGAFRSTHYDTINATVCAYIQFSGATTATGSRYIYLVSSRYGVIAAHSTPCHTSRTTELNMSASFQVEPSDYFYVLAMSQDSALLTLFATNIMIRLY